MIKNALLIALLCLNSFVYGQSAYRAIDINFLTVPDSLQSHSEIANYLTKGLDNEEEKARALYVWIAHNIEYDLELLDSLDLPHATSRTIEETLSKQKGVCQNYAELYLAMSDDIGLESYLISGYTRNSRGEVSNTGHAWNATKIDSTFYLLDITWAAGYIRNNSFVPKFTSKYFLVTPSVFIKTHMPIDPIWQLLNNPIDHNDFISNDFSNLSEPGEFMFADSIEALKTMDELTILQNSVARMMKTKSESDSFKNQLNYRQSNISLIKHNLAVALLNSGFEEYNSYINHRNNRFRKPKLDDSTIRKLFKNVESKIIHADELFTKMLAHEDNPSSYLLANKKVISNFLPNLYQEKKFLNRYLRTWKPLRFFVF